MGQAFDHIVALGYNCRLAYNLRRTFGFETAHPFDWWVTPLQALAAFLRDPSLDRLYDPALLEPVIKNGGAYAIHNVHYGIQMDHEFPRGRDNMVVDDWRDHIAAPRARTEHLLRRFLELPAGSRVLFVRATKKMEARMLGPAFRPLMEEVIQALEQLFPDVNRSILLIDPPVGIKREGVATLRINDRERDWKGTPELWTEALIGLGLTCSGARPEAAAEVRPEADHPFVAGVRRRRRASVG
jgi:hypothetical protein